MDEVGHSILSVLYTTFDGFALANRGTGRTARMMEKLGQNDLIISSNREKAHVTHLVKCRFGGKNLVTIIAVSPVDICRNGLIDTIIMHILGKRFDKVHFTHGLIEDLILHMMKELEDRFIFLTDKQSEYLLNTEAEKQPQKTSGKGLTFIS